MNGRDTSSCLQRPSDSPPTTRPPSSGAARHPNKSWETRNAETTQRVPQRPGNGQSAPWRRRRQRPRWTYMEDGVVVIHSMCKPRSVSVGLHWTPRAVLIRWVRRRSIPESPTPRRRWRSLPSRERRIPPADRPSPRRLGQNPAEHTFARGSDRLELLPSVLRTTRRRNAGTAASAFRTGRWRSCSISLSRRHAVVTGRTSRQRDNHCSATEFSLMSGTARAPQPSRN